MNLENGAFVTPGERVATEEEFSPGSNTFVENGYIHSAIAGRISKNEGTIGVAPSGREIRIIGRDALVIGIVTDDMKNVMFVKLDDINIENKDYLALKDGKIVAPKSDGRFGGRGRFERSESRPEKPCGIGDTIVARVLYNDKDAYTLGFNSKETGVVFSNCRVCGGEMQKEGESILACKECGNKEKKRLSELYNKPEEIKKLFV